MSTPGCGHENTPDAKVCSVCGAELRAICLACAHANPPGARFCNQCGNPLDADLPSETVDAERRQLTVMFCDLVGSTTLAERLDPEEFRTVVRAYQGMIDRAWNGEVRFLVPDTLADLRKLA